LNQEGDLLERLIPDAIQVSGKDTDDSKEEKLISFSKGQSRGLIIKPKIGAWGLNWQHCNHTVFFPTHSYEQYYQAVRRFWRFGQKRPVTVDMIFTEGDEQFITNLKRKKQQADEMFTKLVEEMNNSLSINHHRSFDEKLEVPSWL
jgi:SNF2 family DNA or RNA helicase